MIDKVISLEYPITIAGETISSVTLKRLKAKQIRKFKVGSQDGQDLEKMFEVVAASGNIPCAYIDEMDASDALHLVAEVQDFLESGPRTGPMPSAP